DVPASVGVDVADPAGDERRRLVVAVSAALRAVVSGRDRGPPRRTGHHSRRRLRFPPHWVGRSRLTLASPVGKKSTLLNSTSAGCVRLFEIVDDHPPSGEI